MSGFLAKITPEMTPIEKAIVMHRVHASEYAHDIIDDDELKEDY